MQENRKGGMGEGINGMSFFRRMRNSKIGAARMTRIRIGGSRGRVEMKMKVI